MPFVLMWERNSPGSRFRAEEFMRGGEFRYYLSWGALCSQHFKYGSNYGHVFPVHAHWLACAFLCHAH